MRPLAFVPIALALALPACAEVSRLPEQADVGPNPTLVEPVRTVVPTVNVAKAKGWQPGTAPIAAPGLKVNALVTGLDHPRWIHVLPCPTETCSWPRPMRRPAPRTTRA